jgi:hypothetical protein
MGVEPAPSVEYQVTFSIRVRELLLELAQVAWQRGDGLAFAAAVEEFERRLRVYPQFGDPLHDLHAYEGQIRLGIVPPLAMRYGVVESRRVVLVVAQPVLLGRSPKQLDG